MHRHLYQPVVKAHDSDISVNASVQRCIEPADLRTRCSQTVRSARCITRERVTTGTHTHTQHA